MRYVLIAAALALTGCSTMGKASCYLPFGNDPSLSRNQCKSMWDLDRALRNQHAPEAKEK
jgi:hypothetical protein